MDADLIYMDKKMCFQKDPDTCGWGLGVAKHVKFKINMDVKVLQLKRRCG